MSKLYRRAVRKETKPGSGVYVLPDGARMEWMVPVTTREVVAWVNDQFQKAVDGEVW